MRTVIERYGKYAALLVLLVGLDVAFTLPIVGATCRPFSWMSMAPAGAGPLYPVIQNIVWDGRNPRLSVGVSSGAYCVLQRSTNLLDSAAWTNVTTTLATESVIVMTDSNSAPRVRYYRVMAN